MMIYHQSIPTESLQPYVKSFWMVDGGEDSTIRMEKIVPDGFPEIIFHYQDPYQINISGNWELQTKDLLAGQISRFFHLRNTGRIGMFAIKLQPWVLYDLFGLKSEGLIDQVIPIPLAMQHALAEIKTIAIAPMDYATKLAAMEESFERLCTPLATKEKSLSQKAVEAIMLSKGNINLKALQTQLNVSERTLQRSFKTQIGTSTKLYARIIRLSHIFKRVNEEKVDWARIIFDAGFYDQSHFIKNFKEFTGEEPSAYGFHQENMANLFLRKP